MKRVQGGHLMSSGSVQRLLTGLAERSRYPAQALQGKERHPSFRLRPSGRCFIPKNPWAGPSPPRPRYCHPPAPPHAKGHLLGPGPMGSGTWCCQNWGPGVQTIGQ